MKIINPKETYKLSNNINTWKSELEENKDKIIILPSIKNDSKSTIDLVKEFLKHSNTTNLIFELEGKTYKDYKECTIFANTYGIDVGINTNIILEDDYSNDCSDPYIKYYIESIDKTAKYIGNNGKDLERSLNRYKLVKKLKTDKLVLNYHLLDVTLPQEVYICKSQNLVSVITDNPLKHGLIGYRYSDVYKNIHGLSFNIPNINSDLDKTSQSEYNIEMFEKLANTPRNIAICGTDIEKLKTIVLDDESIHKLSNILPSGKIGNNCESIVINEPLSKDPFKGYKVFKTPKPYGNINSIIKLFNKCLEDIDSEFLVNIYNRCLIDVLVYAKYLNTKDQITEYQLKTFESLVKDNIKGYDVIFYIPDLSTDNEFDSEYKNEINKLYLDLKDEYNLILIEDLDEVKAICRLP